MGKYDNLDELDYLPSSPCKKDCKERHVGCHATCTDYKNWRSALDKINEKRLDDTIMFSKEMCRNIARKLRRKRF